MKKIVLFFTFIISSSSIFGQNDKTEAIDIYEIKADIRSYNTITDHRIVSFYEYYNSELSSIISPSKVNFSKFNLLIITVFDSPSIRIHSELKKTGNNYILYVTKLYPERYPKSNVPHVRVYLVEKSLCNSQPQLVIKHKYKE